MFPAPTHIYTRSSVGGGRFVKGPALGPLTPPFHKPFSGNRRSAVPTSLRPAHSPLDLRRTARVRLRSSGLRAPVSRRGLAISRRPAMNNAGSGSRSVGSGDGEAHSFERVSACFYGHFQETEGREMTRSVSELVCASRSRSYTIFTRARTSCLLYTSDAADERSSVDLGGRRIIEKKRNEHTDAGRSER